MYVQVHVATVTAESRFFHLLSASRNQKIRVFHKPYCIIKQADEGNKYDHKHHLSLIPKMLDGTESDIKIRELINSSDAKISAAARRVFGTCLSEYSSAVESSCTVSCAHGFNISSSQIPVDVDIQNAASAVAMLAPHKKRLNGTSNTTTDGIFVKNFDQSRSESTPSSVTEGSATLKCHSPVERLVRSRERNKMHARKTRQRKKEHMDTLEKSVDFLKNEQISLQIAISEKATANILLGMFSVDKLEEQPVDPLVDVLLKRKVDEIPDATSIPDLPALILPVHSNKKRTHLAMDQSNPHMTTPMQEYPDDGIDYDLLGKDRSLCTSEELDLIRKERNRMHAKRTRDRKRVFMESMQDIINNLQHENEILRNHLRNIGGTVDDFETDSHGSETPPLISSALKPMSPSNDSMIVDSSLADAEHQYPVADNDLTSKSEEESLIEPGSLLYKLVAISHENLNGFDTYTCDSGAASPVCTSSASSCCHEAH